MSEEANPARPAPAPDTGTRLAYERTWLAHERTQMAWVRTALSLISFGFTIAKFFEYLHDKQGDKAPLLGAKTVGILMISAGLVALALSTAQHWQAMQIMRARCPGLPRSLSGISAAFIAVLGILALLGAIQRN